MIINIRNLNTKNIKNMCKKATNSLKMACEDRLIKNIGINESMICNNDLIYDRKNNQFKKRSFDIELPEQVLGDISNLTKEQKDLYEKVLKNSCIIDKDKNVLSIGMLKKEHFNNIINNANDKHSETLNLVNQKVAKHIIGYVPNNSQLKFKPFEILCEHMGTHNFVSNYITGNLDKKIKESIGEIYYSRYIDLLPLIKEDFNYSFLSSEKIKNLYGEPMCKDWSQDEKYDYLLSLLARNDINSSFKACQLLENGYIYCEDIKTYTEHMAMNDFLNEKNKYPY